MDIQVTQIAFQIVNFLIVLFVFKKFLLKPILKVLDERASRIKEGLEAAETNVKLQQDFEDKKEALIKDAKSEAQKIVTEAKKEAETITKQAAEDAKKDARRTLDKERQAFEAQMQRQQQEFQKQMVDVVTDATNAVLKGSLDQKLQKSVVESQIKSLSPALFK